MDPDNWQFTICCLLRIKDVGDIWKNPGDLQLIIAVRIHGPVDILASCLTAQLINRDLHKISVNLAQHVVISAFIWELFFIYTTQPSSESAFLMSVQMCINQDN